MKKSILLAPMLMLLGFIISCTDKDAPNVIRFPFENVDLSADWETADPVAVGVVDIEKVRTEAEKLTRLTSVIVIRDGKLVLEEYFKGFKRDSLHDVRSVVKSVVSMLMDRMISEGFIQSVDDPIGDYLSDKFELTEEQEKITLRNLLTMTGGFEWFESGGTGFNEWITSDDHIGFLLNKPVSDQPGSRFNYNSAGVHLLGVTMTEVTGLGLYELAEKYLLDELSFFNSGWQLLSDNYINGGSAIALRPLDMAKLGQLMLQDGFSGEKRILSSEWVEESTKPFFDWRSNYGDLRGHSYGHLWWTQETSEFDSFLAWGFGGQFIYVVPEKNLVVVTTNNWINSTAAGGVQKLEFETLDLIVNQIIPKVLE